MVVDDSKLARVKLTRLLAPLGWQIIEASDGEVARRLFAEHQPDLVITDVDMPGLDGFGLARAIRSPDGVGLASGPPNGVPVVMITGADERHRIEAACAGVTLLLGKPYGEEALLAHLRRLLPELSPWLGTAALPPTAMAVAAAVAGDASRRAEATLP